MPRRPGTRIRVNRAGTTAPPFVRAQTAFGGVADGVVGAPARMVIKEFLGTHPDIVLAAECANGFEAVKAVSDLYCPVAGKVTEVNAALNDDPSLVNSDPYGSGWMIKLKVTDDSDLKSLLETGTTLAG